MIAHGNGSIDRCTENLSKIVRGEVQYCRLKGIPREVIDMNHTEGFNLLKSETDWNLETFEPRLSDEEEGDLYV